MQSEEFVPGYEPEILDRIEADHKSGRLLPFVEFPLIGEKRVLRFLRRGDRYVCEMGPEEATDLLRCANEAYRGNSSST